MGDAGFPGLGELFPQLAGSSYFRGRDVVTELAWVDGRPEATPHSRCTAVATGTQHVASGCPTFPATTTWSMPIVRARSIDEEAAAAGAAAMEAAARASTPTQATRVAVQPSCSSGRAGHKRSKEQLLEGGDAGAPRAAGRGASPNATLPGAPSSHLSRVEHASYATTLMTYDDVSDSSRDYDDEDYVDDTSLGPRDASDQPASDQDDSVGRRVRSKQVCSDQRTDSKANSPTTASMRERRRRDRFNRNINLLREIIPNTSKSDTVSILDTTIDHLKKLRSVAQMVGITGGNPYRPVAPQEYIAQMMLAAQVTQTSGIGNGIGINRPRQPPNVYSWPPIHYPLGFSTWGSNV